MRFARAPASLAVAGIFSGTIISLAATLPLAKATPDAGPSQAQTLSAHNVPHMSIHDEIAKEDVERYASTVSIAVAEEAPRVVVVLDSIGGATQLAHEIVKLIDAARDDQNIKTDCVVDGRGWSSAFYILQACDRRYMTKRSTLMAHNPQFFNEVITLSSLRDGSAQAQLEAVSRAFAEHNGARLKMSMEEYRHRIDGRQWWLAWSEALKVGAVDKIVESDAEVWKK
jgi:ATP-dependent protease ClpP protease subunit